MEKCWLCGETAVKKTLLLEKTDFVDMEHIGKRCYCEKCFDEFNDEHDADRKEYIRLKKKLMFERAVRILERQDVDIYEYKDAIETVQEFNRENLNRFDSAHEIVATIILIYNEVRTKTQFQVANYRVDFYLPELKVCLEVDGDRHKYKKQLDNERDLKIRNALGLDHEIIRIETDLIEQNAELLVEAIKSIRDERKKLRQELFLLIKVRLSKKEHRKNFSLIQKLL